MILPANASDAQVGVVALLCLVTVLAILADAYTTMIGLEHGLVEGNPLMKWLFKKVGLSFATFISGAAVLFIGGFISSYGLQYSDIYFGIVSAGESVRALLNYRKLKAMKVSLK
jgi:hypothetical protein